MQIKSYNKIEEEHHIKGSLRKQMKNIKIHKNIT